MPEKLPPHVGFSYWENDWRMEGRQVKIVSKIPGKLERYRVENIRHSKPALIGRQTVISGKNLRTKWTLIEHFFGASFYDDGKLRPRSVTEWAIKSMDGSTITSQDGMSFNLPPGVEEQVMVGDVLTMETINYSMVVGGYSNRHHDWLWRKSDEALLVEHEEFLESIKRRDREFLEEHGEDLQRREDALPDWIRPRLSTFHEKGKSFEGTAWGYEVLIAELAVEYAKMGEIILDKDVFSVHKIESEAIKKISQDHGTSGNQHSFAMMLAKAHLREPETTMEGTVSGLSPIGGGAFYDE